MASRHATYALALGLLAGSIRAESHWSYRTTGDGDYRLGRNGQNLRVETRNNAVTFRIPAGWHISICADTSRGCTFSAKSPVNGLSLVFSIHQKLSGVFFPELLRDYGGVDLRFRSRAEPGFRLSDVSGLAVYRSASDQSLSVYVAQGDYNFEFAFTADSAAVLSASRPIIQQILDSYVCTPPEVAI